MIKIKFILFTIVTSFVIFSAGCYNSAIRIDGNHNVVTETRDMPPFNRIANADFFDVYVIQDSVWEVIVQAESNLVPYVRTLVNGTNLTIDTKENLRPNSPILVYVHTPDILALALSGSGIIYSDTVKTTDLDVEISGSGDINVYAEATNISSWISGSGVIRFGMQAQNLDATISGSGDIYLWGNIDKSQMSISGSGSIKASDLDQKECVTNISGSGDMYVNVADLLRVNISGSGSIYYMGNPAIETNITGSGQVIHQ